MIDHPTIITVDDPAAAAAAAIETSLRQALAARGRASLMVSGGSSPKPVYATLSRADLDWKNVSISLVDERWVNPGEAGSNEDFTRAALLQNNAAAADFALNQIYVLALLPRCDA